MRDCRRFRLRVDPIDLDMTLGCGQTFRWARGDDGSWTGVVGEDVLRLTESDDGVAAESLFGDPRSDKALSTYLRASDDIEEIQRALSSDEVLSRGFSRVRGLRLVKMDEWECLISYALATYANIPRIAKMIESLSSTFGKNIGGGVHAFPSVDELGGASEEDLAGCGLGYRAAYVRGICGSVDTRTVADMRRLPYPELRERLKSLPGVGDKVADCVSLFGFGRLEAFPIDVWIQRAVLRLYGVRGSYAKVGGFARDRFGGFAGYAQEYLFFNERMLSPEGRCIFSE
ncbi:TPA: DNA-3-methyladenine glycosylase 2 family protein [Thermoplasmata archaeon]|nr:DNA-3-methyladenine glycosylase 2 family protein [Thermoplasmata archaeon]